MSDCHTLTSDLAEGKLSYLGRAIRKLFGVPCVDSSFELTEQIDEVRKLVAKHNDRVEEAAAKV